MENGRITREGDNVIVFGWIIASLGTVGLVGSVILEIIQKESIYILTAKISAGVLGVGGVILGTFALMGN